MIYWVLAVLFFIDTFSSEIMAAKYARFARENGFNWGKNLGDLVGSVEQCLQACISHVKCGGFQWWLNDKHGQCYMRRSCVLKQECPNSGARTFRKKIEKGEN
jgi:hypothetical protein